MSKRFKQFECDVEEANELIEKEKYPFINFIVSHPTVTFEKNNGPEEKNDSYSLTVSEDYPDFSYLVVNKHQESITICHKRIQDLLMDLSSDEGPYNPPSPANVMGSSVSLRSDGRSVERMVSVTSEGSSFYMDCLSSDNDDDDDDDYDIDQDEDEFVTHPMLICDLEKVQSLHGAGAASVRMFGTIDDLDADLNIPLGFLNEDIAQAWQLNRNEPLVVRLHLSQTAYISASEPPKVEVFQPSRKEKFGLGSQIKSIMEVFLSQQWKKLSNEDLRSIHYAGSKSTSVPFGLSSVLSVHNEDDSTTDLDPCQVRDADVATMMGMGFTAEFARNALIITRNSVNDACNLLVSNAESQTIGYIAEATGADKKSKSSKAIPSGSNKLLLPSVKKKFGLGKGFGRQTSLPASVTTPNLSQQFSDDLNLIPNSTLDGKNAKQVPTLKHGFLYQVFQYVRQRIPTLNEYCVVCDELHVFQNGAMLKPAVCSRELCVFAFQTLGVMSNAAEDIATGAEVVDLLIAMTREACLSSRKGFIFDPFPTIVDPKNSKNLALHPKNKDYGLVESILATFLPMDDTVRYIGPALKKEMDSRNSLAHPLLQWIITSNRSHIMKLPEDRQLQFMHTPHQFLLLSSPPAKEAIFREEKKKHGSTFAFHGSKIENWHSIIRMGLINASGTKLQVNGAAYGQGIYLSPTSSMSFSYSGMGYGTKISKAENTTLTKKRFLTSRNLTCIALCEVITGTSDLKQSGSVWVCKNPNHVCTRFFFVYEDGQVGDSNVDTQHQKYKDAIQQALLNNQV